MCLQIAFIGCSLKKRNSPCRAEEMYQGDFFKKALFYCKKKYDKVFILSAKYGLLELDTLIEPYDMTLTKFTTLQKKRWAFNVKKQLTEKKIEGSFFFYCSRDYHMYLEGEKVLEGIGRIGFQSKWITNKVKKLQHEKI